MKVLLLLFGLLFQLSTYSQDVWGRKASKAPLTVETDKFTGQIRKQTKYVRLVWSVKQGAMLAHFRSVDSSNYLIFSGDTGYGVIGTDDQLIMLLDDDSKVILYPTDLQDYSIGDYTYSHQYYINKNQVQELASKNIKSIRKYTARGYKDFEIDPKHQGNLKEVAKVFL